MDQSIRRNEYVKEQKSLKRVAKRVAVQVNCNKQDSVRNTVVAKHLDNVLVHES